MAKFVMECPTCKMPVLARTGLFTQQQIHCNHCGRVEKVSKTAREDCPQCGAQVVYDRTKTQLPQCAGCGCVIDLRARMFNTVRAKSQSSTPEGTVDRSEVSRMYYGVSAQDIQLMSEAVRHDSTMMQLMGLDDDDGAYFAMQIDQSDTTDW